MYAVPAPFGDPANAPRQCPLNAVPDAAGARCLCGPGYYALLGSSTAPRCDRCAPTSYTDEPNARFACKLCPLGKVANAERTGCGENALGVRCGRA